MSQENSQNNDAGATTQPDLAGCCREMFRAMGDGGSTSEQMPSDRGSMLQRMRSACCETPEPADPARDEPDPPQA